jgi:hypothetical protein
MHDARHLPLNQNISQSVSIIEHLPFCQEFDRGYGLFINEIYEDPV